MKVDTVHYSRKMSEGNYGNLELGMHGQVDDGEDPAEAARQLRSHVNGVLAQESQLSRLVQDQAEQEAELAHRIGAKQRDLERMEKQWQLARAFLEQHGVDVSRYTDVPF